MSMTKTGKVEAGVTPSERSGERSTRIKQGQALKEKEKPVKTLPVNSNDIPLD
jgi:hypothetical protein